MNVNGYDDVYCSGTTFTNENFNGTDENLERLKNLIFTSQL